MSESNLVCVFCASHDSPNPTYNEAAGEVGRELVRAGYGLVYGGGGRGLMGRVAQGVADEKGDILGIIPEALTTIEGCNTDLGRTIKVKSMHERKSLMNQNATAFISLPGGFGTMEELLEMTTWSQIGIHSKPIVLLNTNGFYDPLKAFIEKAVEAGFIRPDNRNIMMFCDTPKEAVNAIKTYRPPSSRYNLKWSTIEG